MVTTQKNLLIWVIGLLLMGLCSCSKVSQSETDEDRALRTAVEYLDTTLTMDEMSERGRYNHSRAAELYPNSSPWFFKIKGIGDFKDATVKKEGDKFIVYVSDDCLFYVEKKDEEFIISDSKNIIDLTLFSDHELRPILHATGVYDYFKEETDQTKLKHLREIEKSGFIDYLKDKYPDALTGGNKTISIKHSPVMSIYRVDVLFESNGGEGVYVTVTLYNKAGKQVGQKTKTVGPMAKGERESLLFTFKTDVVGQVGKIDVAYRPYGCGSDKESLYKFAPLSTNDYNEFLNSKEKDK